MNECDDDRMRSSSDPCHVTRFSTQEREREREKETVRENFNTKVLDFSAQELNMNITVSNDKQARYEDASYSIRETKCWMKNVGSIHEK